MSRQSPACTVGKAVGKSASALAHPPEPSWDPVAALGSTDDADFLHGVAHVGAGRVSEYADAGDTVTAVVTQDRPRRVRLADPQAPCSCPHGRSAGVICEHQVAVILVHLQHTLGVEVNDLVAAWFAGTLTAVASRAPVAPGAAGAPPAGPAPRGGHPGGSHVRDDPGPDDDAGDTPGTAVPDDHQAVAAFLDRLDETQLRSLLVALASDLPDVAEVLGDLAAGVRPGRASPPPRPAVPRR